MSATRWISLSPRGLFGVIFVISVLMNAPGWAAGQKLALLIGNTKYDNLGRRGQLTTPANDVVAVGRKFEELGFNTDIRHNLGRGDFLDAVRGFSRRLEEGDVAVFYYAGHGAAFQSSGIVFLPSDIPAPASDDREEEERMADLAVRESQVLDIITRSRAKVVLAIFDACRNNPLEIDGSQTRAFGSTRGLPAIPTHDDINGLAILYSAGRNQEALDRLSSDPKDDPNLTSVFARVFLQQISTKGLSFEDIGDNTRKEVERLAGTEIDSETKKGHRQRPSFQNELSEDFYLLPPDSASGQTTPSAAATEWAFVKDSKDIQVLRVFRDRYASDPLYAGLADAALKQLETEQPTDDLAALSPPVKPELGQLQTPPTQETGLSVDLPEFTQPATIRSIQEGLARAGCYSGMVDGRWGEGSRRAVGNFTKHAKVKLAGLEPSQEMLDALRPVDRRVCPLVCGPRFLVKGDQCVLKTCGKSRSLSPNGQCLAEIRPKATVRQQKQRTNERKATKPSSNCFTFNNERFCE